jgi:hypothetical protein
MCVLAMLAGCGTTATRSTRVDVEHGADKAHLTVGWVMTESTKGTWMGMCRPSLHTRSITHLVFSVPYGEDAMWRTADPDGRPLTIRAWIDRPGATAATRVLIGPEADRPGPLGAVGGH